MRIAAALDLGGTHLTVGSVELDSATVSSRARVTLPEDASREQLLELMLAALAKHGEGAECVGVAAPGPFDYGGGVSWIEHKLRPLCGVDVRAELASGLGVPPRSVSFLNDAEAFLLGEWWAGAAADHERVVGVTLGTGLGGAFLEEGRPVRSGPRVPADAALYLLTYRGAPVEEAISRAALIARYGDPVLEVAQIAERARAGDGRARKAFHELAVSLGEFLEPWLRSFAASCLVVGGSISRAWDLLEVGLHDSLAGAQGLELAPAALVDDAALIGAARHAAGLVPKASGERVLDAQVAALRRRLSASRARPLHELTVEEARAAQAAEAPADASGYDLDVVELPSPVPIRLLRPSGLRAAPVCIWIPGGGWTLDTHRVSEPACHRFAATTPCAVAMVRYGLAPEHPFPAPLDDCVAAVRWLASEGAAHGLDVSRLAIGGTSAGANLSAAVTLLARDLPLAAQVLVYPAVLHDSATRSMQEEGDPLFLDRAGAEWCWSNYLADAADGENPLASPLRADDLRGLPSALVLTAELDPLRDEGELYAARLRLAGVPTHWHRFDGVPHGFFSLGGTVDAADEAQELVVSTLREAFAST